MKYCTHSSGDDEGISVCHRDFKSTSNGNYDCSGAQDCTMWGGNYESGECDWSGGKDGADLFGACPDLQIYKDGKDCDPACTLTGGYKSSTVSECRWQNINDGGVPDDKQDYI